MRTEKPLELTLNRHMRILPLVGLVALLGACRVSPLEQPQVARPLTAVETRVDTVVASAGKRIENFVPAVPDYEDGGECEIHPLGTIEPNEKLVILAFPDRSMTERTVSLSFDAEGQLLRYNDLRGDQRINASGPKTTIVVDFEQGMGFATNQQSGSAPEVAIGPAVDFLTGGNLGDPQRMIEQVRAQCGM